VGEDLTARREKKKLSKKWGERKKTKGEREKRSFKNLPLWGEIGQGPQEDPIG